MNPNLEQLAAEFTALVGELTPVAGLAEAGQPGSPVAGVADPGLASARPATTPSVPASVQTCDFALKGYHLSATVPAAEVVAAAEILDRAGFALDAITGVDWIAQNEMEVVYDFFHFSSPLRVVFRARVPHAEPEVPTISAVYPGANWHERETHDFFGIRFAGHPNLKPFLLPEDADFHPLRKDYQP